MAMKIQGIARVIRIYFIGTMNICNKFHGSVDQHSGLPDQERHVTLLKMQYHILNDYNYTVAWLKCEIFRTVFIFIFRIEEYTSRFMCKKTALYEL